MKKYECTIALTNYLKKQDKKTRHKIDKLILDYCRDLRDMKEPLPEMREIIDKWSENVLKSGQHIPCKRGCCYCCKIEIAATNPEIQDIKEYIKINNITPNLSDSRRCPFLSDAGDCSIYPVRPLVCRRFMVASLPELCDAIKYKNSSVEVVLNVNIEIMISALMAYKGSQDLRKAFS